MSPCNRYHVLERPDDHVLRRRKVGRSSAKCEQCERRAATEEMPLRRKIRTACDVRHLADKEQTRDALLTSLQSLT